MNKFDKLLKKAEKCLRLGNYNQAIKQFNQYLEINPEKSEKPHIWARLAFAYNSIKLLN